MKTTELIANLTSQLKPVKAIKFKTVDILTVITSGLLCLIATIATLGFRFDIHQQLQKTTFIIQNVLILSVSIISIVSAFRLSIPSKKTLYLYKLPLFCFLLILFYSSYGFYKAEHPFLYLGHGFTCTAEIIAVSLIPTLILFYLIRRAAILHRNLTTAHMILSGLGFGLVASQFTCKDDTALHIILWHNLPAVILLLLGLYISKLLFTKL